MVEQEGWRNRRDGRLDGWQNTPRRAPWPWPPQRAPPATAACRVPMAEQPPPREAPGDPVPCPSPQAHSGQAALELNTPRPEQLPLRAVRLAAPAAPGQRLAFRPGPTCFLG